MNVANEVNGEHEIAIAATFFEACGIFVDLGCYTVSVQAVPEDHPGCPADRYRRNAKARLTDLLP